MLRGIFYTTGDSHAAEFLYSNNSAGNLTMNPITGNFMSTFVYSLFEFIILIYIYLKLYM